MNAIGQQKLFEHRLWYPYYSVPSFLECLVCAKVDYTGEIGEFPKNGINGYFQDGGYFKWCE
ncbi:MAG: hypothetical protein ACHP8A_14135 [Terriglobales bacterium]